MAETESGTYTSSHEFLSLIWDVETKVAAGWAKIIREGQLQGKNHNLAVWVEKLEAAAKMPFEELNKIREVTNAFRAEYGLGGII